MIFLPKCSRFCCGWPKFSSLGGIAIFRTPYPHCIWNTVRVRVRAWNLCSNSRRLIFVTPNFSSYDFMHISIRNHNWIKFLKLSHWNGFFPSWIFAYLDQGISKVSVSKLTVFWGALRVLHLSPKKLTNSLHELHNYSTAKTLSAGNFDAPWDVRVYIIFSVTSKLTCFV